MEKNVNMNDGISSRNSPVKQLKIPYVPNDKPLKVPYNFEKTVKVDPKPTLTADLIYKAKYKEENTLVTRSKINITLLILLVNLRKMRKISNLRINIILKLMLGVPKYPVLMLR